MRHHLSEALVVAQKVCPQAPGDAQKYLDQITSYVLWGVVSLFFISLVVAIGAILGGRLFSMPHASKVGVVSIAVVFVCVIGYFIAPAILASMLGKGCVG